MPNKQQFMNNEPVRVPLTEQAITDDDYIEIEEDGDEYVYYLTIKFDAEHAVANLSTVELIELRDAINKVLG